MSAPLSAAPAVRRWLWVVYGLILAMVAVGGITRLTGSGLSMVEWRPLMGALPPLSEADWLAAFAEYQRSPQYQQVNHWMTLADFKPIFFWEYLHRLMGRLIGLAFFLPWLYFVVRGRLRGRLAARVGVAFILGGLQGALGWYMVKSGLVDVPAVSHYRLAAHLSLAFFVACYLLWLILDLTPRAQPARGGGGVIAGRWLVALLALLAVQIVWGAFMAGTRAGYLYATFPDHNGAAVPPDWLALTPTWRNLVDNPAAIHFLHRLLAYAVAIAALALATLGLRRAQAHEQRWAARALGLTVVLQFVLGVLTVLGRVPIAVATAHQVCALLLLSAALWFAHAFSGGRAEQAPALSPAA